MRVVVMLLAALRRGASLNQAAAAARLKRVPAGWQVAAPTAADAAVVEERQLGHPANMVGVPAVSLCRHGYPQAVLQDPGAHKFGAGMLRLTCPHLCEAVDACVEINQNVGCHRAGVASMAWRSTRRIRTNAP